MTLLLQRLAELSVLVYGVLALVRAMLIDLDSEPGRYSGISWFDKKVYLYELASTGIVLGAMLLYYSYFLISPSESSIPHYFWRAVKLLVALVALDVSLILFDKHLKRTAPATRGGIQGTLDGEAPFKMPTWIRVVVIVVLLLVYWTS